MKTSRWSAFLFLGIVVAGRGTAAEDLPATRQAVAASDARFRYEGRFDFTNPAAPVVIWQDSRIAIDFEGAELRLNFDDVKGQCFFNAEVDGAITVVALRANESTHQVEFASLSAGRHRLVLTKRSEAAAGTVRFRGLVLAKGAQVWAPTRPEYKLRMQFFGDSITAAACNEDGDVDQWDDRRTHNSTRGYAAMTAAAFSADHRNIAVSGMGIATGWTEMKSGQIWDRVRPDPTSPRADSQAWVPDVVFINLGENDDSFTKAKQQPFPATEFTAGFVTLVGAMRKEYPHATIVILRGGMYGGAQSERLRGPWEKAVAALEANDPAVAHFVFTHWSKNHPRVADHRAMADELIAWLREQPFMAPHR